MRSLLLVIFCGIFVITGYSQNAVGIGTNTPAASSLLELNSSSKGLLVPRMSAAQRAGIASPAAALLVFDNDSGSFSYYNGSSWIFLKGISNLANNWSTIGNAGTSSSNFIGTTDNNALRIRINNRPSGKIDAASKSIGLGDSALYNNTGFSDIAIGPGALLKNTDRNNLVAIGDSALYYNGTGATLSYHAIRNTAIGSKALYSNTTGGDNVALGTVALYSNSSGNLNTALGSNTLYSNTVGYSNTAVGSNTLYSNTSGNSNTATGASALISNTTGYMNTAAGASSLAINTTGHENTSIGNEALFNNGTGNYNTATGSAALTSNGAGEANTANGYQALYSNTSGSSNTATGYQSLYNNSTAIYNTADGFAALYYNYWGYANTAAGVYSLYYNTTGYQNTSSGYSALGDNTVGHDNTGVGNNALIYNVDGNDNTALGSGAGTSSSSFNNTVSIGNSTYLNGFSNQAFFGGTSTSWNGGNVGWSTFSDERIKTNISEDVKGLEFITRLRPVTYYRSIKAMALLTGNKEAPEYPEKYDIEKIKFSGFVAQEVEKAALASGYDFSGITRPRNGHDLYSLSYESFVVPLVKAVQEQEQIIESQNKKIEMLEKRVDSLEKNSNKQ